MGMFFVWYFSRHHVATAVYQVTRPGHEHCDATEGILLDITPLVVDGKKLVTLYDKDLTEGVNLLIGMYFSASCYFTSIGHPHFSSHMARKGNVNWDFVIIWSKPYIQWLFLFGFPKTVVSDLWGPQCVRLKVTVKSDNCGENAQCSGKGVCFSNASMVSFRSHRTRVLLFSLLVQQQQQQQ